MSISEKVRVRKESIGWMIWDIEKRLYFWYPYEELSENKITEIINNNYTLRDPMPLNEKKMCFRLSAPLRVYYDITYKCNLSCWYCYNKNRLNNTDELSLDQKKQIVDQMVENKIFKLSIAGGEPLLSKDLFSFVEYAVQRGLSVSLTTNGTMISTTGLEQLNLFDSISISIDFIDAPLTQPSKERPIKCSAQVDESIQLLPSELLKKTSIKAVINPLDACFKSQLNDLADYCSNHMIRKLKISVLQEANAKYYTELYTKTYEVLDYVEQMKKAYPFLRITCNSNPFLSNFSVSNYIIQSGCGCWKDLLIITPYGRVKPCLLFNEDYEMASILEKTLAEIWEIDFKEKTLPNECTVCERYASCLGGCTARRLLLGYEIDPLCMKHRDTSTIACNSEKNAFQSGSLIYCFSHC